MNTAQGIITVADVCRTVAIAGTAALLGFTAALLWRIGTTPVPPPRSAHLPVRPLAVALLGFVLLAVAAVDVMLNRIGYGLTWPLLLSLVGVLCGALGVGTLLRQARRTLR